MRAGKFDQPLAVVTIERRVDAQQKIDAVIKAVGNDRGFAAKGLQAGEQGAEQGHEGEQRGVEDMAFSKVADDVRGNFAPSPCHRSASRLDPAVPERGITCLECNPTATPCGVRRAARSMRRRLRGGVTSIGSIGASSNPALRNAASNRPVFHARYSASRQCCNTQPPHSPKCTQGGGTRASLSCRMSDSDANQPPPCCSRGSAVTRSPGNTLGMNSATPSGAWRCRRPRRRRDRS